METRLIDPQDPLDKKLLLGFWETIEKIPQSKSFEECWPWPLGLMKDGYASIHRRLNGQRRQLLVHRVAFRLFIGPIPEGLSIDHLCQNRSCCNPFHLEAVPIGVNTKRSPRTGPGKNIRKKTCIKGHSNWYCPYTTPGKQHHRRCRTCELQRPPRKRK